MKKLWVLFVFFSIKSLVINGQVLAPTPPMGWNSYNSFGAAVTEADVRANAEYMARFMKPLGWEYIVIDYCWYYPHPPGSIQDNPPQFNLKRDGAPVPWMPMDEYGRLLPDPGKFPSAANGEGFKPLADYIHSLGLKFGIHIMRGIPRQAVWARSPVKGTSGITADLIADTTSKCPWLNLMWGVNMQQEGSQAYYNSLLELYNSWGVDYIKVDDVDLNENYPYRAAEVEAVHKAIEQGSRPTVLSLSLNLKYQHADHVRANSQLWRISADFWDDWEKLRKQFDHCAKWSAMSMPGSWPDADMLQVGKICKRGPNLPERYSRFSEDEQLTHITLWAIARSPLMMGGHLPENTDFTKALLTNPEVIQINQQGSKPRELFRKDSIIAWISDVSVSGVRGSGERYIALFNVGDSPANATLGASDLGISPKSKLSIRDCWKQQELGLFKGSITTLIPKHGCVLWKVRNN